MKFVVSTSDTAMQGFKLILYFSIRKKTPGPMDTLIQAPSILGHGAGTPAKIDSARIMLSKESAVALRQAFDLDVTGIKHQNGVGIGGPVINPLNTKRAIGETALQITYYSQVFSQHNMENPK